MVLKLYIQNHSTGFSWVTNGMPVTSHTLTHLGNVYSSKASDAFGHHWQDREGERVRNVQPLGFFPPSRYFRFSDTKVTSLLPCLIFNCRNSIYLLLIMLILSKTSCAIAAILYTSFGTVKLYITVEILRRSEAKRERRQRDVQVNEHRRADVNPGPTCYSTNRLW